MSRFSGNSERLLLIILITCPPVNIYFFDLSL